MGGKKHGDTENTEVLKIVRELRVSVVKTTQRKVCFLHHRAAAANAAG